MAFTTRNQTGGNVIVSYDPLRSVDTVVISSALGARTLLPGQVLGIITVGGKYTDHDHDLSDGTEEAAGVLLNEVTVPASGDIEAAVIVRDAVVRKAGLIAQPDIESGELDTVFAELTALGIICRDT